MNKRQKVVGKVMVDVNIDRDKLAANLRKALVIGKKTMLDSTLDDDSERKNLLQDAIKTVCKDRADTYGDMESNFDDIAALWTAYLGFNVEPRDVANMMVLLKVARNKTPGHRDNWVDIAGYAACGAEVDA